MKQTKKVMGLVVVLAFGGLLAGCTPALEFASAFAGAYTGSYSGSGYADSYGYSLEVENWCGGANEFVDVYVDGLYVGMVYSSYTFYGLSYGSHYLTAEGTDAGGSYFSRSVFIDDDMVWTLCP